MKIAVRSKLIANFKLLAITLVVVTAMVPFMGSSHALAAGNSGQAASTCKKGNGYCCGSDPAVQVSIDLGCKGKGNPILDLTFAIIRFLSIGVGLVIVGSMVWAGIQYTASRGEPQGTEEAIKRIRSNVTALVLFIFAYAILNYVVPGAVLK
jgi:hypothetical protein